MERWRTVVELRRKWNGRMVGCGGAQKEMEWNSGGLRWNRGGIGIEQRRAVVDMGGNEMEQWWAVVELGRDWHGAVVGRGGNEEEIEWNGGEPWWN